ncbi:MAG TPA: hypothetical protein VE178_07695 [Silvibacterium sp.]|nr:hypothetical protein [Silvibacterium sp.]
MIGASEPTARTAPQSGDNAFPLTCLPVAFGVIAGIALAGTVVPVVVQTVVSAVMRTLTGA